MGSLIERLSSFLIGLLENLATPSAKAWLEEKGWLNAPPPGPELAGSGMLRVADRAALPPSARREKDASGCLVVGPVAPDLAPQVAAQVEALEVGWRKLRGTDVFNWLAWQTRLVPELVGREREQEALLAWAREGGPGPRARILSGPGGQGKTRLAAEVAETLRGEGWAAGFMRLGEEPAAYVMKAVGTLILLDYPEEHGERVQRLLADLAGLKTEQRLRVLLLTRHGADFWQREIDRADASTLFDELPLELGNLPPESTYRLFLAAHNNTPRTEGQYQQEPPTEQELRAWLSRSPPHRRPLLVLAAAVANVLHPEVRVVRLSGAEVVLSLVRRELKRLRDEGEAAGLAGEALPRLTALAAVGGGLDRDRLRKLAEENDRLELGLPAPARIFESVKATGRVRDGKLPAPVPDLLAAALLVEVLRQDVGQAPEWLWAALEPEVAAGLGRLGRLIYDAEVTLGLLDARPSGWLRAAFEARPERCREALEAFLDARLPQGLLAAADTVWRVALDAEEDEGKKAELLNNLSVHLADAGDGAGALEAIQQAVEIRRRLAEANPARFEPDLALSLDSLSNILSYKGDGVGALRTIQEAVSLIEPYAEQYPKGRFGHRRAEIRRTLLRLRGSKDQE